MLVLRANGRCKSLNSFHPALKWSQGSSFLCSAHSWTGLKSVQRRTAKLLAWERSQRSRTDLKEACSEVVQPLHDCSCSPAPTEVIVDACVLQIHSLVRKPEHNGKIARLLDYSREKDRWVKSIWVKSICSSSTHFQFPIRRAICVAASDVLNARQTECEGVRKYACAAS